MQFFKHSKFSLTMLAALALSACGGGGSGSPTTTTPTTPVATTCINGGIDFPVCAEPAKLKAAQPSWYLPNSNEYAVFIEINLIRSKMGLGTLNQNKLIGAGVLVALIHCKFHKSSLNY